MGDEKRLESLGKQPTNVHLYNIENLFKVNNKLPILLRDFLPKVRFERIDGEPRN